MMVERAKAMAIGSSEIATASAGYIGLQPVHALRACPDRAQSRTGGLQTQDDLRPGCLRGPVMAGEPRRGVPPYTNMAAEDETPRGAHITVTTRRRAAAEDKKTRASWAVSTRRCCWCIAPPK